jgi:hypothetical protein
MFRYAIFLVLALASAFSLADDVLSVSLDAYTVTSVKGKVSFSSADEVKPADIIEYRATYKNLTRRPIGGVIGVVPIPQGLTLLSKSAVPAGAEASLDGANFSKIPLMRDVKQADGRIKRVEVPLSEYRAVRWGIGVIPAEKSKIVSLRASVNSN